MENKSSGFKKVQIRVTAQARIFATLKRESRITRSDRRDEAILPDS